MKKYRVTFKARDKTLYIVVVEASSIREATRSAASWQRIESPGATFSKVEEAK